MTECGVRGIDTRIERCPIGHRQFESERGTVSTSFGTD